eukprot:3762227-Amphidinium_carterae.1
MISGLGKTPLFSSPLGALLLVLKDARTQSEYDHNAKMPLVRSLDESAELTRNGQSSSSGRDPPPSWSGEDALRRRQTPREFFIWAADTDTPVSRQGSPFFRALSGRAMQLCDGLEDQRCLRRFWSIDLAP